MTIFGARSAVTATQPASTSLGRGDVMMVKVRLAPAQLASSSRFGSWDVTALEAGWTSATTRAGPLLRLGMGDVTMR